MVCAGVSPQTGRILLTDVLAPLNEVEQVIRSALYRLMVSVMSDDGPEREAQLQQAGALQSKPDQQTGQALRELVRLFPPRRRELPVAVGLSFANTAVNFLPELVLIGIVNVVNGKSLGPLSAIGLGTLNRQVLALGGLAGAAFGLELYVERLRRRKWREMSRNIEHEIRVRMYEHLQRLDTSHIDQKGTSEQMNLLWDSTARVRLFLESGCDDMLQRVITTAIIVITLAAVSPALALTTVAPLPIIALGSMFVAGRVEKPYELLRQCEEVLQKFLSTNLSDLSAIKHFTAEQREAAKLEVLSREMRDVSCTAIDTSSRYTDQMRLLISISFALSMVIGGLLSVRKVITPAVFTLVLFFVPKLLMRLEGMGEGYDQFKQADHAARALLQELGVQPRIVSGPHRVDHALVRGDIVFENIDFGYREGLRVLENFTLTIPAHSSIAFCGATGSGKSTVVKLISRLYDPQAGRVTLDGVDLRDYDLSDLRQSVGVVSQEAFLFDGSVLDNIRFGRPDATEDEVIEAAKSAEAHQFIMALPDGYATTIGERGKQISGGQRQRISIARVILKNSSILVFDEATSAVDNETEAAIQRSIERFTRHRTAILIAHRLSTVRNVDCIHVMNEGRIVESGTHDVLLAQDGAYAALWRVQTGEVRHDRRA